MNIVPALYFIQRYDVICTRTRYRAYLSILRLYFYKCDVKSRRLKGFIDVLSVLLKIYDNPLNDAAALLHTNLINAREKLDSRVSFPGD